MHPGNLFVDARGDIVAVDLGIAGRLGRRSGVSSPKSSTASSPRDYHRVAASAFRGRLCSAHHDVEASPRRSARSANRSTASRPKRSPWRKLLTLLFEVTELFDMETRPELVLLQKTMVVVEGVARALNPRFQHVEDVRTRRERLDRRAISGRAACSTMRATAWQSLGCLSRALPELAARTETAVAARSTHGRERPGLIPTRCADRQGPGAGNRMGPCGAVGDCIGASDRLACRLRLYADVRRNCSPIQANWIAHGNRKSSNRSASRSAISTRQYAAMEAGLERAARAGPLDGRGNPPLLRAP